VDSRPGVIRSINQRWLLNHWSRIRSGRTLPAWQGLASDELVRMTENLTFSDVVAGQDGPRFLIRYHGERIAEAFGSNCRGKYLDQILPPAIRERALDTYRHLLAVRRPIYNVVDISDIHGHPVHYERLMLPFGRDHETVDRVLASLETVSPDGAFEHRDLMKQVSPQARFTVCAVIDEA
jgi:hypothetical protein